MNRQQFFHCVIHFCAHISIGNKKNFFPFEKYHVEHPTALQWRRWLVKSWNYTTKKCKIIFVFVFLPKIVSTTCSYCIRKTNGRRRKKMWFAWFFRNEKQVKINEGIKLLCFIVSRKTCKRNSGELLTIYLFIVCFVSLIHYHFFHNSGQTDKTCSNYLACPILHSSTCSEQYNNHNKNNWKQ